MPIHILRLFTAKLIDQWDILEGLLAVKAAHLCTFYIPGVLKLNWHWKPAELANILALGTDELGTAHPEWVLTYSYCRCSGKEPNILFLNVNFISIISFINAFGRRFYQNKNHAWSSFYQFMHSLGIWTILSYYLYSFALQFEQH